MVKETVDVQPAVAEVEHKGILKWIETVGNKLPHPFMLFVYLCGIFIIISVVLAAMNVSVIHPVSGENVAVKSLLSQEGVHWILTNMLTNFTSFPPLGLILAMTLGIGLAEKVGLIQAVLRAMVSNVPKALLAYAVVFIGILGNIASDAAIAVIPVMGAMLFLAVGRHPLAGFAAGVAGWGAGFTANIMIAGTDALISGISTQAVQAISADLVVTPVDNWFFMSVSTFILAILGGWITDKFVEPRLGTYNGNVKMSMEPFTAKEKRALKATGLTALAFIAFLAFLVVPENGFLRDPETGGILSSPFIKGIIPIILIFFILTSVVYGKVVGVIKSSADVPAFMTDMIKSMASFIVLVFVIAQFVAFFNWTNLSVVLAVNGSEFLESINLTGFPAIILFILFVSLMNLFITSGSAMWSMLAPVFIPMFMLIGYNPAFVQVAYRIADSSTNMITPMSPYLPLILAYYQQYKKDAGIGTYFSTMIPYALSFLIVWVIMLFIWFTLGLPLGPGVTAK
ncbi:aminobenzoyl-glutamate transport protein [Lysinibacillus composti]|uniref:AbgT family transporter n=1 Tax=Lysinibacillus composti TaxID=720633 RepID=A0A3N9UPP1_9BACI|nr:AbgT family transporter [Lysinibacillus composti]MBM7608914.1 aminobenzoyl-glutamate transport protein [Lysinibacillus composti]RQW74492.1 AbgT family transporter [Lysinibacillus composti]